MDNNFSISNNKCLFRGTKSLCIDQDLDKNERGQIKDGREHQKQATSNVNHPTHPIAVRAKKCFRCAPDFGSAKVLRTRRRRFGREIMETFFVEKAKRRKQYLICIVNPDET